MMNRRSKGEGTIETSQDGKQFRGVKIVGGVRLRTPWMRNRTVVASALKALRAPPPPVDSRLVSDAIDGWLGEARIALSTRSGYETSRRNYLKVFEAAPVTELKRKDISEHYKRLADRGLAFSTIHQASNVLSKSLDWAVDHGWMDSNAAFKITLPPAPKARILGFSEDETHKLLAAAAGTPFESRWRLALIWMVRPAESAGLRWSSVDFATGQITIAGELQRIGAHVDDEPLGTVYRAATKTRSGTRQLKIDSHTMRMLYEYRQLQSEERVGRQLTAHQLRQRADQAQRIERAKELRLLEKPELYSVAPDDLIFTLANGDPLLPRHDSNVWAKLEREAGVNHRRRYAARHTGVNRFLLGGGDLLEVSIAAGHSSIAFTQSQYGGVIDARSDKLAAMIDERNLQGSIQGLMDVNPSDIQRPVEVVPA